jgi:hypothetical protein
VESSSIAPRAGARDAEGKDAKAPKEFKGSLEEYRRFLDGTRPDRTGDRWVFVPLSDF